MRQFIILTFAFLFFSFGFSQTTISGKLKAINGKSISGASVTIRVLNTDNILDYSISSNEGEFSIKIDYKTEKIQLKIRSMGYKIVVKTIENKTQTLNFVLEEEITELKEVIEKITQFIVKEILLIIL